MYFKQNADVRAARESFVDAPTAGCPEEPRALSLRSAPVRHCHWYLNSALQLPLQAVHPWDAKLLPGLEALLDAGCRPRTFSNVLVSAHPDGPAQLRGQFDPLDPTDGDPGLDVKDLRWAKSSVRQA